ncbi:MAG: hypothetical protein PUE30_01555 [Spirochaetia bacterium]|nr:hypothetical protein [Spirochaetia bacterium]
MADKKRKAELARHSKYADQLRLAACCSSGFDIQVISKITKRQVRLAPLPVFYKLNDFIRIVK